MATLAHLTFLLVAAPIITIVQAWDFEGKVDQEIPLGLTSFFGSNPSSVLPRIAELETQMQPLFHALPKNGDGGLDATTAKYALHRHLLEHRRWRIEALGAGQGQIANQKGLPKDWLSRRIAKFLDTALAGKHFGLRELATMVVAIEYSVGMESSKLLSKALAVHGVADQELDEQTQDIVIQTFLLFYILPDSDYTKKSSDKIKKYLGLAQKVYPAWEDTLNWVQDLKHTLPSGYTLQALVDEIVNGYRQIFDNQCNGLRSLLRKLEHPGTGRVHLSHLRETTSANHVPSSIWQFSESSEELRSMGVLDESDPNRTNIIIPNYVMADSNCLPLSQIVSTCCMSECDQLLAGLEGQIASPTASAEQLSDWTKVASPNVSEALLAQLEEMASTRGGSLPIHSRAFAQWMHRAFPSKCPYQQDTRTPASQPARDMSATITAAVEEWWPSARQALRGLALFIAAASCVAGLAKTVLSQRKSKADKVD